MIRDFVQPLARFLSETAYKNVSNWDFNTKKMCDQSLNS